VVEQKKKKVQHITTHSSGRPKAPLSYDVP
jgi:hypothetical protein